MHAQKHDETVNQLMKTTRHVLCFGKAEWEGSHPFSTLNDLIPFLLHISYTQKFPPNSELFQRKQ